MGLQWHARNGWRGITGCTGDDRMYRGRQGMTGCTGDDGGLEDVQGMTGDYMVYRGLRGITGCTGDDGVLQEVQLMYKCDDRRCTEDGGGWRHGFLEPEHEFLWKIYRNEQIELQPKSILKTFVFRICSQSVIHFLQLISVLNMDIFYLVLQENSVRMFMHVSMHYDFKKTQKQPINFRYYFLTYQGIDVF